jgi:hypothetical protein
VHVEAAHIIDWLSEHDAVVVGPEKAGELKAVLDALPWIATSPGYQYLCGASADLSLSPNDLAEYEADYGMVWLRS